MSKSAKLYLAAAVGLIGFPLILSFWSPASALMAILILGIGAYAMAACFLLASFWHRSHYGTWPIEFEEDPTLPQRYPAGLEPSADGVGQRPPVPSDRPDEEASYRLSDALQGWLRRRSSSA